MADYYNKERLDYKIWKTILDILKDENLVLKNSLMKIYQSSLNKDDLEQAEQLQSRLINMDAFLLGANNKVKLYLMKLNVVSPSHTGMRLQSRRRHKKLQFEMDELKYAFLSLKADVEQFKQFIQSN